MILSAVNEKRGFWPLFSLFKYLSVLFDSLDENLDHFWVNIRVDSMAQIGDVS